MDKLNESFNTRYNRKSLLWTIFLGIFLGTVYRLVPSWVYGLTLGVVNVFVVLFFRSLVVAALDWYYAEE